MNRPLSSSSAAGGRAPDGRFQSEGQVRCCWEAFVFRMEAWAGAGWWLWAGWSLGRWQQSDVAGS